MLQRQPNCPQCGRTGFMYKSGVAKKIIPLECHVCENQTKAQRKSPFRWQSLAGICPVCLGYNGYPGDGICKSCYERRHGADNE